MAACSGTCDACSCLAASLGQVAGQWGTGLCMGLCTGPGAHLLSGGLPPAGAGVGFHRSFSAVGLGLGSGLRGLTLTCFIALSVLFAAAPAASLGPSQGSGSAGGRPGGPPAECCKGVGVYVTGRTPCEPERGLVIWAVETRTQALKAIPL